MQATGFWFGGCLQGMIATGIDWSEANILSIEPNNPTILAPGHIFHCIPIVYLPGWGYIGVSEQVLVTEDGCEVLSDRGRTCPIEFFVKEKRNGACDVQEGQ